MLASLAVLAGRSSQPASQGTPRQSFDWWGAALSSGALVLFLLAITNLPNFGLISLPILGGLFGFAVLLGAFIWWELHCASPLLDVRLFQHKTFSFGATAALLIFLGSSAIFFLMPFYLQRVLAYSPREAGLILVPGALFMAVLGPLSGQLSDRYGWRRFTVGGLALSATGVFILTRLTEGSSLTLVIPALIMSSSGMGMFYSPNTSSILSAVEQERYGVVSAFLNLVRNGANVTSIAMAAAIVTATMASMGYEPSLAAVTGGGVTHAFTLGMSRAYMVMTVLLLAGLIVSLFKFEQKKTEPSAISIQHA